MSRVDVAPGLTLKSLFLRAVIFLCYDKKRFLGGNLVQVDLVLQLLLLHVHHHVVALGFS